jgi:hypothetical protein
MLLNFMDGILAHALLRAAPKLVSTPGAFSKRNGCGAQRQTKKRSHQCERGTQECVRHKSVPHQCAGNDSRQNGL